MKALVLTCDRYRPFAEHMIACYETLWPEHPFVFHIPYQSAKISFVDSRVKFIKSPPDILGTVTSLLEGLPDEEVVYWSIDDKYPIYLDVALYSTNYKMIISSDTAQIDGVLLCRARALLNEAHLKADGILDCQDNLYIRRKNYKQIWLHQFVKVKVLRHLFKSFPLKPNVAKDMDQIIENIRLPSSHKLYVSEKNYSIFGESTTRGEVTKNCYKSLLTFQIPPPVGLHFQNPK